MKMFDSIYSSRWWRSSTVHKGQDDEEDRQYIKFDMMKKFDSIKRSRWRRSSTVYKVWDY